ncbi:DUF1090 domain-containing protein [Cedecea davisae]|uniref:DUF1090 domain-containing protein n=1 Tax=Cedecea davisae TaxID=158484 RepID=UPI00376F3F7A
MKKIILSAIALLSFQASAQLSETCALKDRDIQIQIDYARLNHNQNQIAGLEAARNNLRLNCTEKSIAEEGKIKIAEKRRKVVEREEKLAEAKRDGRINKIARAESRLSEAREELSDTQDKFQSTQ